MPISARSSWSSSSGVDEKLRAMQAALAAGDRRELAGLAHWLKGTGGTAGFGDFLEPAEQLEQLAASGESPSCRPRSKACGNWSAGSRSMACAGERELASRIVVE